MRFRLTLGVLKDRQHLLFNYQYCLHAWIYKLLDKADSEYAAFLYQKGYGISGTSKSFKHFVFSSLMIPKIEKPKKGDTSMILRSEQISLIVSFSIDKAAESFLIALFQSQKLSLFNQTYHADFIVERVEAIGLSIPDGALPTVRLRTLSPMVIAEKLNSKDQFLRPDDVRFSRHLIRNVFDKYQSVHENSGLNLDFGAAQQLVKFKLLPDQKIKQRGMLVKEGHEDQQTKVIGYHNFQFELTAPREILEVALTSGIGRYSSTLGCGCVETMPP